MAFQEDGVVVVAPPYHQEVNYVWDHNSLMPVVDVLHIMSSATLERELSLIRQRLEAIEEALAEEMTANDKASLDEALKDHREGKSLPFTVGRPRTRKS